MKRFTKKQTETRHPELDWQREQAQRSELCDPVPRWAGSQNLTGNRPLSLTLSLKGRGDKAAFTLAEVLITLGIIGIVAALTMPSLISNHRKLVAETRLKKFYSSFNQAMKLAEANYGEMSTWEHPKQGWNGEQTEQYFEKYYKPYLNLANYCGTNTEKKCFSEKYDNNSKGIKYITADNTAVFATWSGNNFWMVVDINGSQSPNKGGIDQFVFQVYPTKGTFGPYIWEVDVTYDDEISQTCKTRKCYFDVCKAKGTNCAALIRFDGWKIKSDYPYKL